MTDPLYLTGFLFVLIYLLERIKHYSLFKFLGSPVLAILAGAILSNIGIIPHSKEETEIYGFVLNYLAPAVIFILLLQVDLRNVKEAGRNMLIVFFLSMAGVFTGAILFYPLIENEIIFQPSNAIAAGMLVAGHIGGSLNFNSVALHYDIAKNASAFALLLTIDHIFIALWMVVTVIVPKLRKGTETGNSLSSSISSNVENYSERIDLPGITLLSVIVISALIISKWIVTGLSQYSLNIPSILIISCLALIVSHSSLMKHISGHHTLDQMFIYLFLIVVGAHTEFRTLIQYDAASISILLYIVLILLTHAVFAFFISSMFVKDIGVIALGSQACIGGPVSAAALAKSIGRNDLTVSSIIAGSLGGAVGTFLGFLIISMLQP